MWSRSDIDEEYTWSASMKEVELNIPDLTMLSTPPETSFSKWEMDLLRSLVGKLPYLIDDSCERLIDSATSKLERRGNRMLYSAVWDMVVEKSKTSSQAKMFKNDSKALLGDGLGLVHELKEFTAFGNEEANVAASQFGKLTLGASDPVTVDQFLSDLEDGWARAGALVNPVTAISLIDDQFKIVARADRCEGRREAEAQRRVWGASRSGDRARQARQHVGRPSGHQCDQEQDSHVAYAEEHAGGIARHD